MYWRDGYREQQCDGDCNGRVAVPSDNDHSDCAIDLDDDAPSPILSSGFWILESLHLTNASEASQRNDGEQLLQIS